MTASTPRWFPDSMPAPMVDQHTLPWWEACASHRLTAQRCLECNHAQLPPTPICSECRGSRFELTDLGGRGTLYTYTVVHQPVAIDQRVPFVIAIVELDVSGTPCANPVRLMTNIVDAAEDELAIGRPVQVAWEKMSETVSIPRFRFP